MKRKMTKEAWRKLVIFMMKDSRNWAVAKWGYRQGYKDAIRENKGVCTWVREDGDVLGFISYAGDCGGKWLYERPMDKEDAKKYPYCPKCGRVREVLDETET